jgi:hypothetical protein
MIGFGVLRLAFDWIVGEFFLLNVGEPSGRRFSLIGPDAKPWTRGPIKVMLAAVVAVTLI